MKRKSPYEHPVRNHVRQGRPVRRYLRGEGDKPRSTRRKRVVGASAGKVSEYYVTIFYVDGTSETFTVDARNYVRALDSGIESREESERPHIIRLAGVA